MISFIFKKPVSNKSLLSNAINSSNFNLKTIESSIVFFDNYIYENESIAKKELSKKINDDYHVYFCLFHFNDFLKTLVFVDNNLLIKEKKPSFSVIDLDNFNKPEDDDVSIDDLLDNLKI